MQNITNIDRTERVQLSHFFLIGLIILSSLSIAVMGLDGLLFSILALAGVIITPFIYNRPTFFLMLSLFVYPLSRFLPLDSRFVVTALLYLVSLPTCLWVMNKWYAKVAKDSYYLWAMIGYITVILFNFLRPGTDVIEVVKDFGRTFYGIFIIIAIYNYVQNSGEKLKKLSLWMSYLMNFCGLIAFAQFVLKKGGYVVDGFYRVTGTFAGFNDYAFVLSIFICYALYSLLSSSTTKQKLYWVGTITLNMMFLGLTLSKTSIANTLMIFIIMGLILPPKRKLQLFGALTLISTAVFAFIVSTGELTHIISRFTDNTSLDWRYQMWNRLYHMIIQGNVLLGQGANASRDFLLQVLPAGESNAPHNIYLETAFNYGLIGLIPFALIFVFIMTKGIVIFCGQQLKDKQNQLIGLAVMLIAMVTMIQNYVSNAFYDRAGNIIFWAIITLLFCWHKYYKSIEN